MARSRSALALVVAVVLALQLCSCGVSFVAGRTGSVARSSRTAVAAGGVTPLMEAAHMGDADKVKELIAGGADMNAQDEYGWTALRFAVRSQRFIAAQKLAKAGADVNLASKSGRTPLMSAAGNRLEEMVSFLMKNGADKTIKDSSGQTAYDIASRGGGTGCDMIREMVKV
mmetsp:Transcript_6413/g.13642  ORF Transcript_6413/g.13642 Transcript_6413/m.13642 type:complete len:171 (-) Transcript_6413:373-885(-)